FVNNERKVISSEITAKSKVAPLVRTSSANGIGGLVGYMKGGSLFACAVQSDVKVTGTSMASVCGVMVGTASNDIVIDQSFAKGSFACGANNDFSVSANGSYVVKNIYINGHYSRYDYSTNRSISGAPTEEDDVWMKLNSVWVLKVFYW
ncbi:MAG: hypothetical protein IJ817_00710, partial [Clostridia bacterium]|nr:hypothetical protein [Clostridia bacterium]